MIELDLSGHKLSVAAGDLEWLRARAERAAGRSSAASELAGRLATVPIGRPRLVFVRAELRALLNALGPGEDIPPGLAALNEVLRQKFATRRASASAGDPE